MLHCATSVLVQDDRRPSQSQPLNPKPCLTYQTPQEGRDVYDLGEALYGFLVRFGEEFDVRRVSVCVCSGGDIGRQGG